jgi:hypothetical protein
VREVADVDAPRRWQVGSSVTALAGLGLGALLLSRPTIEPVEPIQLIVTDAPSEGTEAGAERSPVPDIVFDLPEVEGLTIVPPVVVEDLPSPADEASVTTVASVTSTASPDDGETSSSSTTSSGTSTSSGSSSGADATPTPAPRTPAPVVDDSPDSVDSADSDDSDD